jgi:pilus assembly protein CpaE
MVTDREALWNTPSVSALIVHVSLFADVYPWQWVPQLRTFGKDVFIAVVTDRVVYDSLMMEVLMRLCAEAGIDVVYAEDTVQSQRVALQSIWRAWGLMDHDAQEVTRSGAVVATLGGAPRDGATSTAIGIACALAQQPSLRIGLLDLHLKSPELSLFVPQSAHRYAHIGMRAQLHTGMLTPQMLWEMCVPYKKSVRVLHGTPRRDTAGDVTPSMMQTLLHTARNTFDITIVDVSSVPDNAATICAVREADVRLLIATQSLRSYMWNVGEWFACFWNTIGVDLASMQLVLNRVVPHDEHPERIASLLGTRLIATVPHISDALCQKAERARIPLCALDDDAYAHAMVAIAQEIGKQCGAHVSGKKMRRSGLASFLMGGLSKGASA